MEDLPFDPNDDFAPDERMSYTVSASGPGGVHVGMHRKLLEMTDWSIEITQTRTHLAALAHYCAEGLLGRAARRLIQHYASWPCPPPSISRLCLHMLPASRAFS